MQPVAVYTRVMLTPSRALDQWLDDLERRKYAPETLRRYEGDVGRFIDSLERDSHVGEITERHITHYLAGLRHLSKNSQAANENRIASWFGWMYQTSRLDTNPMDRVRRTPKPDPDTLDVVELTHDDVVSMMYHAQGWPERLCIGVLAYTGARRTAASEVKYEDYSSAQGAIRFREKSGKYIWKPVPNDLFLLIEQAKSEGVYDEQPFLIPSPGKLPNPDKRSAAIIYALVRTVAKRAGINAHPHALRAAFACWFLERRPGDTEALQLLMGHTNPNTTQIYLRKQNKRVVMERVRDLSWDVIPVDNTKADDFPQIAEKD